MGTDDAAASVPAGSARDSLDVGQTRLIARLKDLTANGALSLDEFGGLVEEVLAAKTYDELSKIGRRLPPVVALTPPSDRLVDTLEIRTTSGAMHWRGRWQLARRTVASTSTGMVKLDLTEATWDDLVIELQLETFTGLMSVVVPDGVRVVIVSAEGTVVNRVSEPPLPGAPVLQVTAKATATGAISIRPAKPPQRRHKRRRFRRRG
jgi:hypothetical protein